VFVVVFVCLLCLLYVCLFINMRHIDWEIEFENDGNKYYVNLRTDVMTMNERPRYFLLCNYDSFGI